MNLPVERLFAWLEAPLHLLGRKIPIAVVLVALTTLMSDQLFADPAADTIAIIQGESLQAFGETSPTWLAAVGKLSVPGTKYERGQARNLRENCSATLVSNRYIAEPRSLTDNSEVYSGSSRANTIVTAWHCLEFYRDLSKPIVFTLTNKAGDTFSSEAHRLDDGGGMYADWAILRLMNSPPVAKFPAIAVHPAKADVKRHITMAGYSRNEKGLSYDPACSITSQISTTVVESNCHALKGASGGAVIQLSLAGQALLEGVVSRGDGRGLSIYVPVASFRGAIAAGIR